MTIISALPFTLQNGTTADATQVMADFDEIVNDVNNNAAHNGVNNDITALTGLTTPIPPAGGGTTIWVGGTSTGSGNAQVVTSPVPTGFSLTAGNRIVFIAGFGNSSAMTINVDGTGATNVFAQTPAGPVAMVGLEIVAGNTIELEFDGTQFVLMNPVAENGGFSTSQTLASATTTNLGSVGAAHLITISGTTTITSFGSSASTTYPIYRLKFSGILLLTYNASSMILPGLTNITTAANDTAVAQYLGSGNWQVISYNRASGQALQFSAAFLQGYINGFTLSTAGGSSTMSIAGGIAADSTSVQMLSGGAATKTTSSWAAGSGNGGLDTGAIATGTWYHWYIIYNPTTGNADYLFSLSATAPTTPSGFTLFRRIGSGKTDGSSHWLLFTQTGNRFIWSVTITDNGTAGTARSNLTLTGVPTGVVVEALGRLDTNAGGTSVVIVTSLQESDQAPTGSINDLSQQVAAAIVSQNVARLTNTSAQVGMRANNAGVGINYNTYGWIDFRGQQ